MAIQFAPPALAPGPNWASLINQAYADDAEREFRKQQQRAEQTQRAIAAMAAAFQQEAARKDQQEFSAEQARLGREFSAEQQGRAFQQQQDMAGINADLDAQLYEHRATLEVQKQREQLNDRAQREADKLKQHREFLESMKSRWPPEMYENAVMQLDAQEAGLYKPENFKQPPDPAEVAQGVPVYDPDTDEYMGTQMVDMSSGKLGPFVKKEAPKSQTPKPPKPVFDLKDIQNAHKDAERELADEVEAANTAAENQYQADLARVQAEREQRMKLRSAGERAGHWFKRYDPRAEFPDPPPPQKLGRPTKQQIKVRADQLLQERREQLEQANADTMMESDDAQPQTPIGSAQPSSQPAAAMVPSPVAAQAVPLAPQPGPPAAIEQPQPAQAPLPELSPDEKYDVMRADQLESKIIAGTATDREKAEALAILQRIRARRAGR